MRLFVPLGLVWQVSGDNARKNPPRPAFSPPTGFATLGGKRKLCFWRCLSPPCQEKPRARREQSREPIRTHGYQKLQTSQCLTAKLLSNHIAPYSKNKGRRYSPQGGFNPPPFSGRRSRFGLRGLLHLHFTNLRTRNFKTQRFNPESRFHTPP